MDFVANLALGIGAALQPINVGFALMGCLIGTLIGVLPGIGPLATLSMLLPITFYLEPITALIMLSAIYYGAQYGGSTTAILVNLPGESSAVVTCIDGHQMARQGRAGSALAVAALGSFFAGSVATLVIAVLVFPLTALALTFGAADYFSLMVLGLVAAVVMARGSIAKALAMVVIGLLLGLVGTDIHTGLQRFTFGVARPVRRARFRLDRGRHVRLRQHHRQPRGGRGRADHLRARRQDPAAVADARGFPARLAGVGARHHPRLRARRAAGRRRGAELVRRLFARAQAREDPSRFGRARSRAWRGRSPPTMPARRPPSSRCSRSAFRQTP